MWLSRLHDSIQVAFDWFDYQAHVFALDDLRFGNPQKRDDLVVEDDRDVTLGDLNLAHRDRMTYDYQFGEGWRVDIRVEKTAGASKGVRYPACIGGERAGPPEDCGGVEAFHDMLACRRTRLPARQGMDRMARTGLRPGGLRPRQGEPGAPQAREVRPGTGPHFPKTPRIRHSERSTLHHGPLPA